MIPEDNSRVSSSELEIFHLVRGLDNLCWNLPVQVDLLVLGQRAVPARTVALAVLERLKGSEAC